MRRFLKDTKRTRKRLEALPKLYVISCCARFGVSEFPYAGKYTKTGIPYVYEKSNDGKGRDVWVLKKLTDVASGRVYAWSLSCSGAKVVASYVNGGEDVLSESCSEG